jgi:hypothetical protein
VQYVLAKLAIIMGAGCAVLAAKYAHFLACSLIALYWQRNMRNFLHASCSQLQGLASAAARDFKPAPLVVLLFAVPFTKNAALCIPCNTPNLQAAAGPDHCCS